MRFTSFLVGLAVFVTLQTVVTVFSGQTFWVVVGGDLVTIFLAQLIYLIVIAAMTAKESRSRAPRKPTADPNADNPQFANRAALSNQNSQSK
ncbi:hypothetical protein [Thioclava indica]|uniref:Exopolysaccharide production repressor protein exox n=1 Tax=Thioclava indica TaxID=1353528 RepID=A0A074JTS4_9RHOB|nr:hypothetical protein [Thioclava indica]KEO59874.1 hypothetical protein DT23_15535 [Thioclava indica]